MPPAHGGARERLEASRFTFSGTVVQRCQNVNLAKRDEGLLVRTALEME
jgi:hypothetical protein